MKKGYERVNKELDRLQVIDPSTQKPRAKRITDKVIAEDYFEWSVYKLSRLRSGKLALTPGLISILATRFEVREDYLLCYDDFRTEEDKVASENQVKNITKMLRDVFSELGYYDAYHDGETIDKPESLSLENFYRLVALKLDKKIHDDHIIVKNGNELSYVLLTEDEHKELIERITDYIKYSLETIFMNRDKDEIHTVSLPKSMLEIAQSYDNANNNSK